MQKVAESFGEATMTFVVRENRGISQFKKYVP
jgi:hypothetical protein